MRAAPCFPGSKPAPRRAGGFSLLEILCAIVLLGFGLVALLEGTTMSLRASKSSEWRTVAALLAAGRLETLRAEGYISAGEEEGEFEGEFAGFAYRQTITEHESLEGLYRVEVEVIRSSTPTASVPEIDGDPDDFTEVGAADLATFAGQEVLFRLETLLFEMPFNSPYGKRDLRDREREMRERGMVPGGAGSGMRPGGTSR